MTEARRLTISYVEPDARRAASVRVTCSSGTSTSIPADRAVALGLVPGRVLDERLSAELAAAADEEGALRAGLAALGRRSFARAELGRRLRRRGHPVPAVSQALDRLAGMGLVDDARFVQGFIASRAERGRGPARLRRDLLALGVAAPVIEAELVRVWPSGEADPSIPLSLASRRSRQLGKLAVPAKRRRLLAFLARRGFTGPAARSAVTTVLAVERRAG